MHACHATVPLLRSPRTMRGEIGTVGKNYG